MPEMTFRYRILPGGRRVRDVPPNPTVDLTEEEAQEFAGEPEKSRKRKPVAEAENDE